ncbi:MAG: SUMF1/EgtB/PvdO family nonheme iron enzyme, partial [Candidatus Methanospirare jalkutatii]|nr:SUMF1/EgtB/PvdO family nonheme iron enzyme [Candidatus Methanospirare jalkutatii]
TLENIRSRIIQAASELYEKKGREPSVEDVKKAQAYLAELEKRDGGRSDLEDLRRKARGVRKRHEAVVSKLEDEARAKLEAWHLAGAMDLIRRLRTLGEPTIAEGLSREVSEARKWLGTRAGEEREFEIWPGVKMAFVWVPAGTFKMGSPSNEPKRDSDEGPVHEVEISRGFWMGKYEVTQGQWQAIMGENPSEFKNCGSDCPVENVSWEDCQEFIGKLNGRLPSGAWRYRLPTEAEWEYACRAGTQTALYTGPITIRGWNNAPELDAIAWYGGNSCVRYERGWDCSDWPERQYSCSRCGTHPVGRKEPNAWGLYDMLGNVWEWCQDWYGEGYYKRSPRVDPKGPASGSYRVERGGGWNVSARGCRCADRSWNDPGWRNNNLGLRLVRAAD